MLLEPDLQAIELEVADLKFNETVFRQKARPGELTIRFLTNGCAELLLLMPRQAYGQAADGGFGDPVPANYLNLADARLLGNRDVAVDPQDGFPRYRLRTPNSAYNTITQQVEQFAEGQDWKAFLHAKPEMLILQDRYFGEMCASGQININALLLAYAQQADVAPSVFAV
ncbi:MAG: hypothetical protein EOO62_06505 [Hymenobacter sp.]|nr:MAG: hypothetical protein EOO62_06505 [Hymenobacter sp.]